jgi:hypothetical protein
MELTARAYRIVADSHREFWYEENCWPGFVAFFSLDVPDEALNKTQRIRKEAFRRAIERVITNTYTRDLFEKECHGAHCIWSMKLFKGGQNTRVFCHHSKIQNKDRFTFSALIEKKKSQKLTPQDLQLIERIAKHIYTYIEIV